MHLRRNRCSEFRVTNNHAENSSPKTEPVTVNGVMSSQHAVGLFHWLHLGKSSAGSVHLDAVITDLISLFETAFLVVFTTVSVIRTGPRADPSAHQSPTVVYSNRGHPHSFRSAGSAQEKGASWTGARLLHALWSVSVLFTQLAQTSHSVYFPISALCICKYAPKGAALGELVTKQPEITAKFAHKVRVKNLSIRRDNLV